MSHKRKPKFWLGQVVKKVNSIDIEPHRIHSRTRDGLFFRLANDLTLMWRPEELRRLTLREIGPRPKARKR